MQAEVEFTPIQGLIVLHPKIWADSRGFFTEMYRKDKLQELGIEGDFIQDNLSFSYQNVIRGLHFQAPPYGQAKLVTVFEGKVLDVAVDLRNNSPTYGNWYSVILDSQKPSLFYIPIGFAHGFSVLSEKCLFYYKCSNYYHQGSEGGIVWNDPTLNINWQVNTPIVSEKDAQLLKLQDFKTPF